MGTGEFHLMVGWGAMLLGAVSGAVIGLFFHAEQWAGGYGSWRRRLMRLGHIAFFGLGILNVLFGLTLQALPLPPGHEAVASAGFLIAVISMPLCCFLAAWRKPFRHLFPVPVLGVAAGVVAILLGRLMT